jgi:hypothetical protein
MAGKSRCLPIAEWPLDDLFQYKQPFASDGGMTGDGRFLPIEKRLFVHLSVRFE